MITRLFNLFYVGQPLLALAWLFGIAARDRWRITMPFYYIPPTLVVVLGLVWLLLFIRRRPNLLAGLVAALTAVALMKIAVVDFGWQDVLGRPRRSIRAVHWNVARGIFGPKVLQPVLAGDQADIYLLSEYPTQPNFSRLPHQLMRNAHVYQKEGMLLISRFPFELVDTLAIPGASGWCARLATPFGSLDLLAIDLVSDPHRLRRGRMAGINQWVAHHDKRMPLIILGDFNTPRDSIYLEALREHVFHAYEKAGRGWPYTWPWPLPVYSIDHAWVSPKVRLYQYQVMGSRYSDHCRQILDLLPNISGLRK